MVLRMGQIREPYTDSPRRHNRPAMISRARIARRAAGTPGWVRDATYAINALARRRHGDEAKLALDFFLDADCRRYPSFVAESAYRISTVRYYGDGREEADYSGFADSQHRDRWLGLFLWGARTYSIRGESPWLDAGRRRRHGLRRRSRARRRSTRRESRSSAWRSRRVDLGVHWGNRQHFLYTTGPRTRLLRMAALARRAGRRRCREVADAREKAKTADEAEHGRFEQGARRLARAPRLGREHRDGSTVDHHVVVASRERHDLDLDARRDVLSADARRGYKRVEGSNDQYDTERVDPDLASGGVPSRGQRPEADQLLTEVTAQATVNYDRLPS